jgi:bifunctional UDP-N-acetylglucosamine pyrophosphorylase/glucosamine-1-phosphate N-acetyltransferase/UDP-N-acetylglucosamine pyrophosphorylase
MEPPTPSPVAVVLAAGQGTRMNSDLPKVLFPVLSRPMIEFVLDALAAAGIGRVIVVVGYRAEDVKTALSRYRPQTVPSHGRSGPLPQGEKSAPPLQIEYALQTERLGTGHAAKMAAPFLQNHDGPVLVVTGDSPLLQPSSVQTLLAHFARRQPACLLGTLHKASPDGLGRIVRDDAGNFVGIVEEKDATPQQRQITEVNMSTYVFDCRELLHALAQLRNDNRQREFYLTDCPGILRGEGKLVEALPVLEPCEALSINTLQELQLVEAEMIKMGYQPP